MTTRQRTRNQQPRNLDRGPGEDPPCPVEDDIVVAAAVEAEQLSTSEPVLGTPGPPMNRRSPFMVGLLGAAGVAVTYALVQLLVIAADALALIGLSLFLAVGLEPFVAWLNRLGVRRQVAVAIVAITAVAIMAGFLIAAIPILTAQVGSFAANLPHYLSQLKDHSATFGWLDSRMHLSERITQLTNDSTPALSSGLLTAGRAVLDVTVSTLTVFVLTIYLLVDLPRIRRLIYRMTPASRRARVILIGDEVSVKVGQYVLGNLVTSGIAGAGTLVWLLAWRVPYPFVLAITVAIFDLIPIVGSSVAGVIVILVALTVSIPIAVATAVFYIAYRIVEDYLITPRVIGRAVHVPGTATLLAVLVGGAALGLLGALVAIPVAAAIDIVLRETIYPRLDNA